MSRVAVPPTISIVISTFNRPEITVRCVDSCLRQSSDADQIVVVDDHSSDDTVAILQELYGNRIDLVVHSSNRGINPTRFTGVETATSEWIAVVDSDWELLPHTVQRFRELIAELPAQAHAIRARMEWDTGRVTPEFMPDGVVGYVERVEWVEREGGFDALVCMHRSAFRAVPYMHDRRGTVEELYELDLAKAVPSIYSEDVLGRQYFDAPNSYLRTVDRRVLIPQLLGDAEDLLWMAETVLERHGEVLRSHGPRQYAVMQRLATSKSFLSGQRRRGLSHARQLLRRRPADGLVWFTCVFGVLGRTPLAYATLLFRMLRPTTG